MTEHQILGLMLMFVALLTVGVWTQTIRLWILTSRILKETTEQAPAIKTTLDVAIELLKRTQP